MSGRRKCSGNNITVSVIRSADGKKSEIAISLSSTLNALKDAIKTDKILGPIQHKQQRLFYMGRELKSGNRSLEALGIGKHNVFSIHLHSLAPKTVDLLDEDNDAAVGKKKSDRRKKNDVAAASGNNGGVIDLAESSTQPSSGGGRARSTNNNQSQRQQTRQQTQQRGGREKVVELLDSDSDDDVEVVEVASTKRRRRK